MFFTWLPSAFKKLYLINGESYDKSLYETHYGVILILKFQFTL